MNVPEIKEVKEILQGLKEKKVIQNWELPYENLLTRRSAAIFFFTPTSEDNLTGLTAALSNIPHFSYRANTEKKLSGLQYRLTFSEEEKVKNESNVLTK